VTSWNTTSGPGFTLHFGYPDEVAYAESVQRVVDERVASRIASQDKTVWGPLAEAESGKRLSWVQLAQGSRPLVDEILELRANLQGQGLTRVVLCGMGGSSLAP
jgi:glucose-6-phosphate isomerase